MKLVAPATVVVPGRPSPVVLRITNDRHEPASFTVSTIGLSDDWVDPPLVTAPIAPGTTAEVTFSVHLPAGFPSSRQVVGVLAEPLGGGQPLRADLVLEVGGRLGLQADLAPRDIRGGDDGRFKVVLVNDSPDPATVSLEGLAPEGRLRVDLPRGPIEVGPGETREVAARVKGGRPLTGQSRRLPFIVRAGGSAPPAHLEGSFTQTPVLSSGVLRALAVLTVLALWLGALGVGLGKLNADDDDLATDRVNELDDEDDEGGEGGAGDDEGGEGGEGGEEEGGGEDGSEAAGSKLGGTVDAAEPGGVTVRVAPVSLTDEDAVGASFAAVSSPSAGKRMGAAVQVESDVRQTVTDDTGQYALAGLRAPAFYLVTFSKPGYGSRSFVVETTEDGEPIALDVLLEAGPGTVSGVVVDSEGRPLGGAAVTVTDGTVTLQASTPTTGDGIGQFEIAGLTTPGSFLVTSTRAGYGTESTLVELDGSGSASGLVLRMFAGVGSVSGRVLGGGEPLGGVSVTISGEGLSRSATTLTDDPIGSYLIPQLPIPGEYTVEVVGTGFATSTQRLTVDGNEVLDIELSPTLGRVHGFTLDQDGNPLPGVGVTLRSDTASFKTTSVDAPMGAYELDGVPAGTYVATFERFGYTSATQTVTVGPGGVAQSDATLIELEDRGVVANATITGTVTSLTGDPVTTGEMTLLGTDPLVTTPITDGAFTFSSLPAGIYNLQAEVDRHELGTARQVLAQASTATVELELTPWASASGVVRSGSAQGPVIAGAALTFTETQTGFTATTTTSNGGTWSLEQALPAGTYRVDVTKADHIPFAVPTLAVPAGGAVELNPVLSFKQILEVEVRRAADGSVLIGAEVTLLDLFTGQPVGTPQVVSVPADGSNNAGIVTFRGLDAGYYFVLVGADGFLSQGYMLVANDNNLVRYPFHLAAGAGVGGRVEWDDSGQGQPVGDATLSISGIFGFDEFGTPTSDVREVTTSAGGSFTILDEDLPIQGNATITVQHPDFVEVTLPPIDLRAAGASPAALNPITLVPLPGSATGELTFAPGAPDDIDDLEITVERQPAGSDIAVDAVLDPDDGIVDLVLDDDAVSSTGQRVLPGNYRLGFSFPGHVDQSVDFRVEPNDAGTFTIELEGLGSIVARVRATVLDVSPASYTLDVPAASVTLTRPDGTTTTVTADSNGDVTFDQLQPGTYRLGATSPSHRPVDADPSTNPIDPVSVVVGPGAHETQVVQMVAHGRIVGRVRAQDGTATIDLDVDLTVTATYSPPTGNDRSWSGTDPAGTGGYSITGTADGSNPGLPNGTLQMGVRLASGQGAGVPGYTMSSVNASLTTASRLGSCNGGTDRCDLTLVPLPGAIRGRVVDGSGTGINGVTVTVTRSDGSVSRTETTTDCPNNVGLPNSAVGCYGYEADGANDANTLNNLPHGTYSVVFSRTGFKSLTLPQITVSRDQTNTLANQTLDSSSTNLTVDVRAIYDAQQDSVALGAGVSVRLYQSGNAVGSAVSTNSDGEATFSNLADGQTYQIRASAAGYGLGGGQWPTITTSGGSASRTVTLTALQRSVQITLTSAVMNSSGQNLVVAGAGVSVSPTSASPGRPSVSGVQTDANGLLTVQLPAGSYEVDVDGGTSSPAHLDVSNAALTVPATSSTDPIPLPIQIQESRLRGAVTVQDGEGAATTTNVVVALDGPGSNNPSGSFSLNASGVANYQLFVAPASYAVSVSVEGSSDHTVGTVSAQDLGTAGDTDEVDFTLLRLGDLRVRVDDDAGQPVSGATVTIVDTTRTADTGASGLLTFNNLVPQSYTIRATTADGRSGEVTFVLPVGHVLPSGVTPDAIVVVRFPPTTTTSTTSTTAPPPTTVP